MKIGRELAANLAAYIPVTLTQQILTGQLPEPCRSRSFIAATLFSDISGFTAMSEELASDGPRGAEELNRTLLLTFTGMIDIIHELGGAVNHFHGDAMSVYFPDEDGSAARRALACAQTMQQLMLTSLSRIVTNRPPGKNPFFDLTMKIGVGYGRCRETIVGDPAANLEHVLAGTAVEEAAAAEKAARSGQVIASRTVLMQADLPAPGDFNLLRGIPEWPSPAPILDWDAWDDEALARLVTAVTPFIPPAIYERTLSGIHEIAEHRPVTSLFVQFDFHDQQESDHDAHLQHYFQWARQVVGRFGSRNARLNRVLTGDKGDQLHIIFGAPVAPDAPDQAIRCALALQRERPAFVVRQHIGLAAGKVFASPVGAAARREYTVVGDVVNLSARLAQVCPDGQVLTDKTTADRVREFIEFEALPPLRLKGKQTEVAPYQPRRDQSATDQGSQAQLQVFVNRWQRPLVGREQEVDLLLGGMDAALRSVGGTAAVYGPTGVGKTSLLAVGVKHWLDSGGMALAGESQQHTTDIPFGPWRGIWRDLLGLTPAMSVEAQVTAVIQRTQALVPDCGDDVGLWGDVLGLPLPHAGSLNELTAEVRQARFFNLVRQVFQAVAIEQPLLIALEGLHWADQSTLALIDELSIRLENQAIFLAVTFRPAGRPALELLNRPLCVPIVLSDLPPQYGRQLLQQLVGTSELPPAVEQHLGLRGRDGSESPVNPLFLEEAVNVMMGLGVLRRNGRLQVEESLLVQMQIPDTIHGLLLARIDRLPVANRDLLQVASVIGRQFNLNPLVFITPDISREVATELLADLSAEDITQLMTTDPEWSYLFQHAMTHEVAYESLPFARRQALHAAVADWLAARHDDNLKPFYAVLAYHYSRADNHEQGLRYALAAAETARDIFANREAVELYTLAEKHWQALGNEVDWETAVTISLSRGDVFRLLGDFPQAIQDAERALDLASTHDAAASTAQAYNLLSHLKYNQSLYGEVLRLADRVIANQSGAIPPTELARANMWAGMASASLADYDHALTRLQQAEEICLAINNNQTLADVLGAVAFVYYSQKKLEAALETMQRAVTLSRSFSTPVKIGFILNNIALIQFNLGRPEEALATLNETAVLAQDTSQNLLAYAIVNRAEVHAYLGHFSQAHKDLEKAINLFSFMNDEFGLVEAYLLLGYEYYAARGELDEATVALDQAQQLIQSRPDSYLEQQVRASIGQAKVSQLAGASAQAHAQLQQAEEIVAAENLNWWLPAIAYLQGKTSLAHGNGAEARAFFQKGLDSVENGGRSDYLPLILLELGLMETSENRQVELLQACLQTAEKRARYLDRLACFRQAGQILAGCDDPDIRTIGEKYLALVKTARKQT